MHENESIITEVKKIYEPINNYSDNNFSINFNNEIVYEDEKSTII
jgi:hypothetical protein